MTENKPISKQVEEVQTNSDVASSVSPKDSHIPYFAQGTVVAGFGRGSKELGIPTANFSESIIRNLPKDFECGVYYGWAQVVSEGKVYGMTMCVGWNPFYHNTVKTMETHILHDYPEDFYGEHLRIIVMGFLRPMRDFDSLDSLIQAIHRDNSEAREWLRCPKHLFYRDHPFFSLTESSASTNDSESWASDNSPVPSNSLTHLANVPEDGPRAKGGGPSSAARDEPSIQQLRDKDGGAKGSELRVNGVGAKSL